MPENVRSFASDNDPTRAQLGSEIAHWRHAVAALADLEVIAAPAAWQALEGYLQTQLRDRLRSVVQGLAVEGAKLETSFRSGASTSRVRSELLRLRNQYLQVETVLDFFGDAINSRTNPATADLLRGLDVIAADSMDVVLRPLGFESPPALVYFDKGLGASILRSGIRLWDQSNPSPAAAIKITRHNASHPTALLHETGHQVAHTTGWTAELGDALATTLRPRSRDLAAMWQSWASEIAADTYAFALAGWAPTPALANVVDGPSESVYRLIVGDPHPFPFVRVLFNTALCRTWFGAGPWDALARTWCLRHPVDRAPADIGTLTRLSVQHLDDIMRVCTKTPMQAFAGRPLHALVDPRRVAPKQLEGFARRAGDSLLTSSYLARRDSIRTLAWLATRSGNDPANASTHRERLVQWISTLATTSARPRTSTPSLSAPSLQRIA